MTLSDEIAAISAAVAATSIAVGVWQYRRTVHRDIFRVYADKYNSILKPEAYQDWQDALKGDKGKWTAFKPTMIAYLNLIWEECFLAVDGTIPGRLWRLWLPEIKTVLCTEFAQEIIQQCEFHFPDELSCGSRRVKSELGN
jgi:hypothetical protein